MGRQEEEKPPHLTGPACSSRAEVCSVNWGFSLWVDGTEVKTREDILRQDRQLPTERTRAKQSALTQWWLVAVLASLSSQLSPHTSQYRNVAQPPPALQPPSHSSSSVGGFPSLGFRQHFNCRENDLSSAGLQTRHGDKSEPILETNRNWKRSDRTAVEIWPNNSRDFVDNVMTRDPSLLSL